MGIKSHFLWLNCLFYLIFELKKIILGNRFTHHLIFFKKSFFDWIVYFIWIFKVIWIKVSKKNIKKQKTKKILKYVVPPINKPFNSSQKMHIKIAKWHLVYVIIIRNQKIIMLKIMILSCKILIINISECKADLKNFIQIIIVFLLCKVYR